MSLMNKMNNTCISHLLIPETDQIQIVVSRVASERGKPGATDITVTTMNRNQRLSPAGFGDGNRNRLPPLFLSNSIGNYPNDRLLRPASPAKTRIPSPSGGRRSSASSTGQSGYGSRGSLASSSVSVPASPTINNISSKYHQSCVPPSASYPSGFPQLVNSSPMPGNTGPVSASMNNLISNNSMVSNEISSSATTSSSTTGSTIRRSRNSRSRSRSRNSSPYSSSGRGGIVTFSSDSNSNSNGRRRNPAPVNAADMDPEKIEEYLLQNPQFLDNFVTKNVDQETLECWLLDRHKVAQSRKSSLSRWKFGAAGNITASTAEPKKNILQELAKSLQKNNSRENSVMWELASCISSAVSSDNFILYLADKRDGTLCKYKLIINNGTASITSSPPSNSANNNDGDTREEGKEDDGSPRIYSMREGLTMAAYVGQRRSPLRLSRSEAEARFPEGIGENPESQNAYHILCHPIIRADGEISGVIELHRNNLNSPFYAEDEEVVNSYVVWGGIALHYAELNAVMNKSKKLNEFLLDVVRSIFQDMVSMDTLIKKIMNFAQKLVDADRASLFLLDNKKQELYARLFDMGGGQDLGVSPEQHSNAASQNNPTKEIRFPIGTGIAGQVASSGRVLNIPDAYADERFNRAVDQITGYHTKSILCMPVFIRSTVIGVVQMVNKRSGTFNQEDEEAFQTFAVYCGLALHHAKLYDKIRRSEQKFKVALEVLSYHNTCNEDEFDKFKAVGVPHTVIGLDDFYFVPMTVDDNQKIHYTLYMFIDLFGLVRFDIDELYRFVLTVRKNYRRVPYHNWQHGFAVANSMYCILKKSSAFRPLECLALFIGSLCHDLDHRGRNNKFMSDVGSPLAAIYTTSTMEHHHFNQTVTILQQEGHNIFSKLSSEEYKQVLGNIKHCILATDLALFFPNKARLQDIVEREAFSWGMGDHRLLIEAIAMTGADLCASSKPWEAQRETVRVIFEEFYEQGDFEKRAGRTPIPMMDREKEDEQPASQVGFLSGICIPCYTLLERLIPESRPLLEGVQKNLQRWKELADEQTAIRAAKAAAEEKAAAAAAETVVDDEAKDSSTSTTVNGDAQPNGSSNPSTPSSSQKSSANNSKSLQKPASSNVPVNQSSNNNNSSSSDPKPT